MEDVLRSFFHDDITRINETIAAYQSTQKVYTKHTLVNFIVNSEYYSNYYSRVSDALLTNVFGKDVPKTMDAFKETYHKNNTLTNQCFDLKDLQETLKQSTEFKSHFDTLIHQLYYHYTETSVDEILLQSLSERIHAIDFSDETISIDDELTKYVKEHMTNLDTSVHIDETREDPLLSCFNKKYKVVFETQKQPSTLEFLEYIKFKDSPESIMDAYFQTRNVTYDPIFEKTSNAFLELFNREMTVFEYKKYSQAFALNDTQSLLQEYHTLFNEKYSVATNLYKLYFDDLLDYHVFCRSFLDHVDLECEEFCQKIVDCMIHTDKYSKVMNQKISTIHAKAYEVDISGIDAIYFFSEIIKKKLHLEDEQLPQTISQLKNQTEEHMKTLNEVFQKVLHRDADLFEREQYIYYFRDGYDISGKKQIVECRYKASIRIEHELYDSMEYQDVLKDWLKTSLQVKNQSILYKIMLYITKLDDHELIRNKTALLEKLKTVFQPYF